MKLRPKLKLFEQKKGIIPHWPVMGWHKLESSLWLFVHYFEWCIVIQPQKMNQKFEETPETWHNWWLSCPCKCSKLNCSEDLLWVQAGEYNTRDRSCEHAITSVRCMGWLMPCIGLNMGSGKPMVFPKWVAQVWVRFLFLAHHSTPLPITTVSQVCTGKLWECEPNFYCFFTYILSIFISVNLLCHTVMEPYIWLHQPCIHLHLQSTSPLTPTPIPLQKQCKL